MKFKFYKKVIFALAIVLTVLYLIWRIFFTIPTYHHLFSFIIALLLLLSELLSNFTAFILIWLRLRFNSEKEAQGILPEIDSTTIWPDVDVIIVTHDEEVALLQKTINAAVNMTPGNGQKVNIVIADDGNRPEIRRLAMESHVQYIDMPGGNQAAKAGNINHALQYVSSPLLVVFDADMIPYQTFLLHSVPYFIKNINDRIEDDRVKSLGFLQTPQSFYNADIFQYNLFSEKTSTNEQDFFSRDINILNGSNGVAIFTGSGALFKREAVDAAGGFPEKTLTEDFELGIRINIAGFASISTKEPESSGMTPMDVKSVIKQRVRWARGVMQSSRNLHIFMNRKIPLFNRLILINVYLYWWSFLRRMLFILAPILFVLCHVKLVDANFWLLLIFWAPGYLLLHYVMNEENTNIRGERWGEIQETFFAPYLWLPVY
ncbi:glycosyltransferase family 2 protein [Weissella hellenica]|uniref:glycosyltransferase family 2 protein n=1 Tax=Weissella hellenica TaxID=46256 RepID=UPI0038883166